MIGGVLVTQTAIITCLCVTNTRTQLKNEIANNLDITLPKFENTLTAENVYEMSKACQK